MQHSRDNVPGSEKLIPAVFQFVGSNEAPIVLPTPIADSSHTIKVTMNRDRSPSVV